MSPTDLEEILDFEPYTPWRIILASGAFINLPRREELNVNGLSLCIRDHFRGRPRLRFVSIPNILLLEPMSSGSDQ
jgi:hypothetical protein